MERPTGVLLDGDGTPVDSNDAHARAWAQALAEVGVTVAFAVVRRRIGKGGDKLLLEVSGIDAESEKRKESVSVAARFSRPNTCRRPAQGTRSAGKSEARCV